MLNQNLPICSVYPSGLKKIEMIFHEHSSVLLSRYLKLGRLILIFFPHQVFFSLENAY